MQSLSVVLTEVFNPGAKAEKLETKEERQLLQWQGPSPILKLIHNRKGASEWLTHAFNKYSVSYTCSLNRNEYKQPAQARISKTWLCSFQTKTRLKPARKKWKLLSVIDVCLGHRPGHPRKPHWGGWQCQKSVNTNPQRCLLCGLCRYYMSKGVRTWSQKQEPQITKCKEEWVDGKLQRDRNQKDKATWKEPCCHENYISCRQGQSCIVGNFKVFYWKPIE